MACTYSTFELYKKYFEDKALTYGELGAQFICGGPWGAYGPPYFKDYFNDLNVVSFDYSGENNSLKLNLSILIDEQTEFTHYKNYFNVLTNFGTTEHVQNQYNCWKNIFDMLKVGGVLVSDLPNKNSWANHSKYFYDKQSLLSLNKDFELVEHNETISSPSQINCTSVLRKINNSEFLTTEKDILDSLQIIRDFIDTQGA